MTKDINLNNKGSNMETKNLRTLNDKDMKMITGGNLEAPVPHSTYIDNNIKRFDYLITKRDGLLSDRAIDLGSKHAISA